MTVLGDGAAARYDRGTPVPGPGGLPVIHEQVASDGLPPVGITVEMLPVPRLSTGLELHGVYQGSGFTEPRYIARRGDGQVVQLSRLLYLVASSIDGASDIETVSHRVSARHGREVSSENVRYLIEQKLDPLGVTVPDGQPDDEIRAPRSDLLLALKGHRVLFNEHRVARIARALTWLHRPAAIAVMLAAAAAMDLWLFAFFGAVEPVLQVLDQPVLLLVVFVLTVASLVFHEFGHASACRYGGARPGCIGCGLFLIWPSLYADVTDVYRIGRAGRLRTDLGGVYFNVVFMLAMAAAYFGTGWTFFLAAVYLGHFEILEQLMPAVRLDGYYILGDLAGVPDLYGKIKPILLSLVPGHRGRAARAEVAGLKRSARAVVATWVLTMVPLLAAELGYALWNLPRISTTMARSLIDQLAGTGAAFVDGQIAAGLVGVIGCVMLLCPMAGVVYLSAKLGGRVLRAAVHATAGKPRLRAALCALALATLAGLSYAWVSGLTPDPLPKQPPIAPILQPGVSTAEPPTSHASSPRPHRLHPSATNKPSVKPSSTPTGPGGRATASPSVGPSRSRSPAAKKPSPAPSSTASQAPPVKPSGAPATPLPSASSTASPTPASPAPSPSTSPTHAPSPSMT
ncbi:hypothetical protein [Streptomyces sp. WM6378]|uniref:hypothetical protein n=1 Tax=Streptomyces sp. WM6378 TaxID=1415557 RepID=UPI0006AF0588|nr:hypothetical protein [Streptomyces sp. WM6378]KOU52602.1 membrane protein [Streptomyces sp. WM6378]